MLILKNIDRKFVADIPEGLKICRHLGIGSHEFSIKHPEGGIFKFRPQTSRSPLVVLRSSFKSYFCSDYSFKRVHMKKFKGLHF